MKNEKAKCDICGNEAPKSQLKPSCNDKTKKACSFCRKMMG